MRSAARAFGVAGGFGWSGLCLLLALPAAPGHAAQDWRGKRVYFGDAHWHSCLSQDADRTLTEQYHSMLYDYGIDFSLQSDHAEGVSAGIFVCDTYLPFRGVFQRYSGNEIAGAMKQAADDWNGIENGGIRFVTFPGYEWAPDARCWEAPFANDRNGDDDTPGHINYFFSNTTGWSYGPDVWEPGNGDNTACAAADPFGAYYTGSRDWIDEILGQLIHQRDDPDRDYDLMIQYNHPAASIDKGGSSDHFAKWFDFEHSASQCSVAPGGAPCSQNQCEATRRAYGLTNVEWYASHEASLGSTEIHPYAATDPQCASAFSPVACAIQEQDHHDDHHIPGRYVASRGLREGYDLAAFGGSDSHNGKKLDPTGFPHGDRGAGGRSLTVVYAGDATRSSIWDGLTRRRTYTLSRFREIGPVHKGRVDFYTLDDFGPPPEGPPTFVREVPMGDFAETLPEGSGRDFTISAAAEQGSASVYPRELRLYRVGPGTPLSARTDVDHYWLDDVDGSPNKLGELVGRRVNTTQAPELTHTFTSILVRPGDAVFAVVVYSDDTWIDDYYDVNGQELDADGDGLPDPGRTPAQHSGDATWARTTPIFFYAANERATASPACSHVSFAGSGYADAGAAGAGDAGIAGDDAILPVAQPAGYDLEWNQWMVSLPADSQYVNLSFVTSKDEDDIGHLFAVRIDGRLLYAGRAGIDHAADALVERKDLPFPLLAGLHKIEVHMDDQEYASNAGSTGYHCNDYDGPPGFLDAIAFHNAPGANVCGDVVPPVITCPADLGAECSDTGGSAATDAAIAAFLAGASATDAVDPAPVVTNDAPAFFPVGATEVTFTATDASGNGASCSATVTVSDTLPPAITSAFALSPASLRPPNHELVSIDVPILVAQDICDPAPRLVCAVDSDEPPNAVGDGDTPADIVFNGVLITTQGTGEREVTASNGTGTFSLQLRAERAGSGDGRQYTATCLAIDAAGTHSAARKAATLVPH